MLDIRGVDLPLLVSLDVLLEEKHVTRAAARLHLSQPAMSAQLARLRALFGDPLLVPADSGRGMLATPRALELQAPLRAALAMLGQAVRRDAPPFDPRTAERTFHIAGNDNAVLMLMLPVVQQVASIGGPRLKLAFRTPEPEHQAGQLERGEIDLLVGGSRFIPDTLSSAPVLLVDHRMAQRKGHPRGTGPLDLDQYCALRHIVVSTNGSFHAFMDEQLAKQGRARTVPIAVAQYNLVPPMLAATDLVCTLPSRFLDRFDSQLDTFELPLRVPALDLSLAWHPRSGHDAGLRWLREQVLANAGASTGMPQ
jgi:DNA-binding transcriptional LysR family regulator